MTDSTQILLEDAQAAAQVLHNVLIYYPSAELMDTFKQNQLGANWPRFNDSEQNRQGRELVHAYLEQYQADQHTQLSLDYGQLFFGPGRPNAMPWGSVYLGEEGILNDDSTTALRRFLKDIGLVYQLERNLPADHIALLFGCIAELLQAILANPDSEQTVQQLIELLQSHVFPWSDRCFSQALEHANSDFFKGLALLAQDLQCTLTQALSLEVESLKLYQ
ncbi:TorD/DmsD family molecular chaperone [Paraferrimonas sedimenticola]|uniref:Molecular chaperone TorD n=1 Tax=Paraferrimonas sedimenticola TaxID=375674 RepID=A0AA37RXP6_9GAMM|nr:molecular chaperone TorD family protein [Paraferrimonas sedimenticola]GLP97096.1 molecular chaperone TorD [Paraferrimonas sedimenticola]